MENPAITSTVQGLQELNRKSFIPHDNVRISEGFFGRYQQIVHDSVIPYQWEALNDRAIKFAYPTLDG